MKNIKPKSAVVKEFQKVKNIVRAASVRPKYDKQVVRFIKVNGVEIF